MRVESRVAPRPSNHTYESIEPDRFIFVMDRSVDAQRSPPASCQVGCHGIYLARVFLPSQKGDPDRFCLCRLSWRCRLGLAGSIARLEAFILAERIHPVGIRDRFDRDAVDVMAKGPGSRDRDLIASRVHIGCHRLAQSRDADFRFQQGTDVIPEPERKGSNRVTNFRRKDPDWPGEESVDRRGFRDLSFARQNRRRARSGRFRRVRFLTHRSPRQSRMSRFKNTSFDGTNQRHQLEFQSIYSVCAGT